MCGINGFVDLQNDLSETRAGILSSKLKKMNQLTAHRGPDSDGFFFKDKVGFAFNRLSIIDLSSNADQPMANEALGLAIIFNGEIYNYLELKVELQNKGYTFQNESDTEVILLAYKEYGEFCVHHFNGMWAFAIYDFRTKKIFCSRDRFGVKPFYYAVSVGVMFFSSELKAIHSACGLNKANFGKVYEYLAYGYRVNDGETFFEDCSELLPGTNLIIESAQIETHRYWQLGENHTKHDLKVSYEEAYLALFEDAVKIRFRSDVSVAIMLSGGLDSTAIAKVADRLIESGCLHDNILHAYTASFPDFEDDETALVREFVATCDHIKLHEMRIEKEELVLDFEKSLAELDQPLGSFASIAHNKIMKLCKKEGIKVVLNGQGSDEAFAGYIQYIAGVFLVSKLFKGPVEFWKEYMALRRINGYSNIFLISQMFKAVLNQSTASYLRAKYREKTLDILNPEFVKKNKTHFKQFYKFSFGADSFNKYLLHQINYQGINTILQYEDSSSMNQSIEIRSPFMDYRLMEFAFSIPVEMKFSKGITKKIQRDTIGKDLPSSISRNRKKIGFRTPFLIYLEDNDDFKKLIFSILDRDSFKSRKIWDALAIKEKFANVKENKEFPFWRIINLEIWAKAYGINNL
ncbi:asparagine synthase (glutamine-hydrolysing) [Belliella buryatensis]|uniref:asparagine synthase (glutamine-hydrolyzing) n=1 Tax=Belliella buryatensis TaxID=1500549 RepID=A0A239BHL4_9BACT|nr:asparagine synthase (glutamine-hydrolyzing) [Belliella buryatensis]SNS07595.1 asparagine synthase (glutamine-hydrolysing) [Belliella buryatensis]